MIRGLRRKLSGGRKKGPFPPAGNSPALEVVRCLRRRLLGALASGLAGGVLNGGAWPAASHPSSCLFLLLTHCWRLTKSSASCLSPLCVLPKSISLTQPSPRFLGLSGASESPGGLVKRQSLVQEVWGGGAQEPAFLTSFQATRMLPVRGRYFQ